MSGRSAALTGIGVLAVLLGGTFLIMFVTVEALLYRDIENVSQNMAKHLSEHGTDLHPIRLRTIGGPR